MSDSEPAVLRHGPDAEYYFDEGCYILELANNRDDDAVSIARARVLAGTQTRKHRLNGIVERYVILQGHGRIEVEGLAVQTVAPGDVVVIPAGCSQCIANVGDGDLVFLAICTPRFTADCYERLERPE